MGFNQHTRGTWVNNMIYNVHLLVGKISEPGNGPFSLTGQPSACGTAREVGTFRPPPARRHGGDQPEAPRTPEKIWKLPAGTIPGLDRPARHCPEPRAQGWQRSASTGLRPPTTCRPGPNVNGEIYPGWRNPAKAFVVVSTLSDRLGHGRRPDPAFGHVDGRKACSATPSAAARSGASR